MKLSYEMVNAPFNTVKEDLVCFCLEEICVEMTIDCIV